MFKKATMQFFFCCHTLQLLKQNSPLKQKFVLKEKASHKYTHLKSVLFQNHIS